MRLEVMGCTRLECTDINECSENNGGCDQKCINRYGSLSLASVSYKMYKITKNNYSFLTAQETILVCVMWAMSYT